MKHLYILLCSLLISLGAFAHSGKDSLQVNTKTAEAPLPPPVPLKRSFEQLDEQLGAQYSRYRYQESEFTDTYITQRFAKDSTLNDLLAPAVGTFETLDESGNYIDVLTPSDLVELPVGLRETIGNVQYFIGISSARFTPEYSELTVFVRIVLPQSDGAGGQRQLFFGGNHIKLSHQGGLIGQANIVLLGDIPIKIGGGNGLVILKGGMDMDTGNVEDRTFVTVGCDGFQSLSIEADVEFPRSMMEPVTDTYEVDNRIDPVTKDTVRVRGNFKTTASDWNDILVEISLPKFQLTNFKGTIFELNTAVFDFSDMRNSPNIVWPQDYQQYLVPGNENLWRGIYVNSLKIVLPKQFQRKNSNQRVFFAAQHMLIDGMGVSGRFSVNNLLPINEGSASGWQFSVTQLQASFSANQLVSAGFSGGIVLPVSKNVQAQNTTAANPAVIRYNAVINPQNNEYTLTAGLDSALDFDVFSAKATLQPNSRIELTVADDAFRPKAILHGTLDIAANKEPDNPATAAADPEDKTVGFKGILFQNLQLQTEIPYLTVDYFGYQGDVLKLAGFPVSISNIGLTATAAQASLEFDIAINLMENAFNGQTRLGIVGSFAQDEGFQKWKYDRLTLEAITIGAELSGMKFDGTLILRDNDPVYGNGFQADLNVAFEGLGDGGTTMSAKAIFGRKEFRYWALEVLANNLNINAGGALVIKGFGGGASYRMQKVVQNPDAVSTLANFFPTQAQYRPDSGSGLGVKAALYFSNQANADVFNGGAGFEMAFNSNGGLNRISIFGEAHFMQSFAIPEVSKITDKLNAIQNAETNFSPALLDSMKEIDLIDASRQLYPSTVEGEAGINAYAAIEYDFTTRTLHGSFDVYIDVAGGVIRGRASGNRAGWAVVHFAPDKWYIHMGTPTDRLGIKMGIGGFNVETGGYFMIGDEMPPSPPPPAVVANILGFDDLQALDYMRDENALNSGRGMAFGSDFSVDTGDMKFLIFYARFQAGAGFDIMVKDYGDTQCMGSGQIGINGWYANGQAYAYLQGELGIRIKLFFVRKKIPIIKAGAAVLLQAKLPNPAWFRGYLGGHYNLLGGLVKGKFRFKIEIGEECEMIGGGPLDGLKIIADISPSDNTSDVDVFAIPQVAFNMAIDSPFELENEEGQVKQYRIKLEEFTLYDENNQQIQASLQWNENNDVLSLRSSDILPPETPLRATVKVVFEERQGSSWQLIYEDGIPAVEEEQVQFTTGVAPDYIPVDNIVYAYPMLEQQYMYPEEHPQGYIKLDRGQPYLFQVNPGWSQQAVFTAQNGSTTTTEGLSYNSNDKLVQFSLPELINQQRYSVSLLTVPPASQDDQNVAASYTEESLSVEGNTTERRQTRINSVASAAEQVQLLDYQFNTSRYNSFAEKMTAKTLTDGFREIIYSDVHALRAAVSHSEPFSKEELSGGKYSLNQPLITAEAVLDDAYFTNEINPLIYAQYPLDGDITVDRNTETLGFPPAKAMDKLTWYETYLESDPYSSFLSTRMPYRYYLTYYYKADFIDLQYKIVNRYLQNPESYQDKIQQYNYIITAIFPYIKPGNYNVKYQYVLPGAVPGSSKQFIYTNPQ